MKELLKISNLSVSYGGRYILKDINLSIRKNQILGIVGESGCGKTTLLKAIMQLTGTGVKIEEGFISYEGRLMSQLSKDEIRAIRGKKIGVIFQNPESSLNPSKRIKNQFYETIRSHSTISKNEILEKIHNIFLKLNLKDTDRILNSYPFELSGGMNQRIAIALAMIMEPDLLLADEPTSALDVTVQSQVVDELIQLKDKFKTSVLIITHNMGVVAKMADTVGVMYEGELVEFGEKEEVLKKPMHSYTKDLIAAVPKINIRLPKDYRKMQTP